jgi:glycosyltransferase involved in cell wall biosynthesis
VICNCDSYISLHRSEGFGLTMAEAMYFSKPVIATGYSGNLEFMNEENSFLVSQKLLLQILM